MLKGRVVRSNESGDFGQGLLVEAVHAAEKETDCVQWGSPPPRQRLSKMTYPIMVGLALSAFTSTSFAVGTAEQRAACAPDAFRLCSAEIPNVDRIIACMTVKRSSLSPACRSVFDASSKATEKSISRR
jgi:hypothetical protein